MAVLSVDTQKQVEDELLRRKLITPGDITKIKEEAKQKGQPFMGLLVSGGHVSDEELTGIIAKINKVPYVNLSKARVDSKVLELLPQDTAEHYMAVPLGEMQNSLVVAMLDADNLQAVDFLSNKIGRPLKVYSASESGIRNVLKQYKLSLGQDIAGEVIGSPGKQNAKTPALNDKDKTIKTIVQDSPISEALSTILEYAASNRASDVHMEPTETMFKIRCRIDGMLREIMQLRKSTEPALVSRVKILSSLKIDEHRIPQDGDFSIIAGGHKIDLRIAISPVVWGEQVVIRLLDKSGTSLRLEDMGYGGRTLRAVRNGVAQTSGMVLTSGPTGSGKSTSMYALLQEIKSSNVNIVTMEDPVEYKIDGINQIQVNNGVGLTFASGLRSILRQDPDVIMVGEIRDKETAELAVQAALTGHLVFSTLHTNSAGGILPRLLDMGVEPFLIASTVRTVIGQRLVRRIGSQKENYTSDAVETAAINTAMNNILPASLADQQKVSHDLGYQGLPLRAQNAYTLSRGIDSLEAPEGYKGRMGIYEAFEVTNKIQDLILKRSTSGEIQAQAQTEGMVTMREDGYLKVLSGQTTVTEINRVASEGSI
ncbi:MAG: GspE/PulE family protein [Candidatus Saccharimonadales bacterium]